MSLFSALLDDIKEAILPTVAYAEEEVSWTNKRLLVNLVFLLTLVFRNQKRKLPTLQKMNKKLQQRRSPPTSLKKRPQKTPRKRTKMKTMMKTMKMKTKMKMRTFCPNYKKKLHKHTVNHSNITLTSALRE